MGTLSGVKQTRANVLQCLTSVAQTIRIALRNDLNRPPGHGGAFPMRRCRRGGVCSVRGSEPRRSPFQASLRESTAGKAAVCGRGGRSPGPQSLQHFFSFALTEKRVSVEFARCALLLHVSAETSLPPSPVVASVSQTVRAAVHTVISVASLFVRKL